MKLRVAVVELTKALNAVSLVTPRPLTSDGGAGYRFDLSEDGECVITSRDSLRVSQVSLSGISLTDGSGSFVLPLEAEPSLRYVDGWVEFEAGHDIEGDNYWLKIVTETGATIDRGTFDARLIPTCTQDLETAKAKGTSVTMPAAVLREVLTAAKAFAANVKDERSGEETKTLQVFPDLDSGDLYATDQIRSIILSCSALAGKEFSVHSQHLSTLLSYLKSNTDLTLITGENQVFAVGTDNTVLGWTRHTRHHDKMKSSPLYKDGYIFRIPKDMAVKALKFAKSSMDKTEDKIKISYDADAKDILFSATGLKAKVRSTPIPVVTAVESPVEVGETEYTPGSKYKESFVLFAALSHILELVEDVHGHEVFMRFRIESKAALIRTVEEYHLTVEGKTVIGSDQSSFARCLAIRNTHSMT